MWGEKKNRKCIPTESCKNYKIRNVRKYLFWRDLISVEVNVNWKGSTLQRNVTPTEPRRFSEVQIPWSFWTVDRSVHSMFTYSSKCSDLLQGILFRITHRRLPHCFHCNGMRKGGWRIALCDFPSPVHEYISCTRSIMDLQAIYYWHRHLRSIGMTGMRGIHRRRTEVDG
jgi:hypothetical protein